MTAIPTVALRAAQAAAALNTAPADRRHRAAAEAAVWVVACIEQGVTLDQLAAARRHVEAHRAEAHRA